MLERFNISYYFDHYASPRRTSNHTAFPFEWCWESRRDQRQSNACLIHPKLVIARCYVQYACANHPFLLSQSIHHVNCIENRTELARRCKYQWPDTPLAKFVGSRCILEGLLLELPLLDTLKVWGWLPNLSWDNCQDLLIISSTRYPNEVGLFWSLLARKRFGDLRSSSLYCSQCFSRMYVHEVLAVCRVSLLLDAASDIFQ